MDIEPLFDLMIILQKFETEKPIEFNYKVCRQIGTIESYYIGDNVLKDFITPNKLGWTTICLIYQGKNIYTQNFNKELIYLPKKQNQ